MHRQPHTDLEGLAYTHLCGCKCVECYAPAPPCVWREREVKSRRPSGQGWDSYNTALWLAQVGT